MNNNFNYARVVATLLLLAVAISMSRASDHMAPSMDAIEAIRIANEVVGNENRNRHDLELVTVKKYSTVWNELMPEKPVTPAMNAIQNKLTGRDYWLIYFLPRADQLGGDIGVFVDADSKEVIYIYRGR